MLSITLAAALLGQCYIINGKMVCPLPQRQPAVVAPPKAVIRYIQPRSRPKPKPQPAPTMSFNSFEKWY